jgi:hypothetical protein
MSATLTFDTMEGWWHQHAHGTNKIYRKEPEHLAQYASSGERRRRVGVRQSRQRKPIESLYMDITVLIATERAPTASQLVKDSCRWE